jgi:hypothetical protein
VGASVGAGTVANTFPAAPATLPKGRELTPPNGDAPVPAPAALNPAAAALDAGNGLVPLELYATINSFAAAAFRNFKLYLKVRVRVTVTVRATNSAADAGFLNVFKCR